MKVVILSPMAAGAIDAAAPPGVRFTRVSDPAELPAALEGAEALVTAGFLYTPAVREAVFAQAGTLKLIQLISAGFEQLQQRGTPPGLVVANAGDTWSPIVAEHAFALATASMRRVPALLEAQKQGRWDRAAAEGSTSLNGATALIVGFGSIGRELAPRLKAFGARVVGLSASARPNPLADEVIGPDRLHAALGRADVVFVCCPHSPQTHHLFDRAAFAACKPSAVLVNVGRGPIVDTEALIEALNEGRIAGAGLDVTDPEPLPEGHPLWACPNLIVAPHVAGVGERDLEGRMARLVRRALEHRQRGETVPHVVSPEGGFPGDQSR